MNKAQQRFYDSITAAIKSNNYDNAVNVLLKESGNLLQHNKKGLVRIVKEAGGNPSENISDGDLAKKIASALLTKNNKFIDKLVKLILAEKATHANDISSDDLIGSTLSTGISAIGTGIANAKYGKQISEANQNVKDQTSRQKLYEAADKIIAQKYAAKISSLVTDTDAQMQAKISANYKKAGLIAGGTLVLSLVIWVIYKASK
jgi:hypothetical protein